jgi:hypothetical protein
MLVGCFLYLKNKSIQQLYLTVGVKNSLAVPVLNKVIYYENICVIASIFLGAIFFSGVISRVFGEHLPVFG